MTQPREWDEGGPPNLAPREPGAEVNPQEQSSPPPDAPAPALGHEAWASTLVVGAVEGIPQWALERAAQVWMEPSVSDRVMDEALAIEFAKALAASAATPEQLARLEAATKRVEAVTEAIKPILAKVAEYRRERGPQFTPRTAMTVPAALLIDLETAANGKPVMFE